MAWTYLAESEASHSPWHPGLSPSPIVKLTDTAKECCCRAWLMGDYLEVQYGMTFHRSMAPCYQKTSTSFMEDHPARISVLLELSQAWMATEAKWFSKWLGWSLKFDRLLFFWKTSLGFAIEDFGQSSADSLRSGMIVAGMYYPLATAERPIKERDFGSWPTPTARDYKSPGISRSRRALDLNRYSMPLSVVFKMRHGYRLPPNFVEYLMGYGQQHTVLKPWAMQWFRSARARHLKD